MLFDTNFFKMWHIKSLRSQGSEILLFFLILRSLCDSYETCVFRWGKHIRISFVVNTYHNLTCDQFPLNKCLSFIPFWIFLLSFIEIFSVQIKEILEFNARVKKQIYFNSGRWLNLFWRENIPKFFFIIRLKSS